MLVSWEKIQNFLSCLGPLLFLIYINDLCNVSKNEEFIFFADDTNIFVKAKTEAETIDLANKILQNVSMYNVYVRC